MFHVDPYLGKPSNLTHIFQQGWFNHQLENLYISYSAHHPPILGQVAMLRSSVLPGSLQFGCHDVMGKLQNSAEQQKGLQKTT